MAMKNIFDKAISEELISRINTLTPETTPQWGKMSVDQMLAHCCVMYEMAYDNIHPKATGLKRILLKAFVKKPVVNEKPYPRNSRTAPQFLITNKRVFEKEKDRLIAYIKKTQELGANHFNGKEYNSFGVLTATEWNNMFYKHLDHHLSQFGV